MSGLFNVMNVNLEQINFSSQQGWQVEHCNMVALPHFHHHHECSCQMFTFSTVKRFPLTIITKIWILSSTWRHNKYSNLVWLFHPHCSMKLKIVKVLTALSDDKTMTENYPSTNFFHVTCVLRWKFYLQQHSTKCNAMMLKLVKFSASFPFVCFGKFSAAMSLHNDECCSFAQGWSYTKVYKVCFKVKYENFQRQLPI